MSVKTNKWVSINKKEDFILLKKKGRRRKKEGFFIIYRKNDLSYCRFILFFPRWTGNAVCRNRFKRWARHFLREKKWSLSIDLLLGFEKKEKNFYKKMNYKNFCSGFEKICQRIDVWE